MIARVRATFAHTATECSRCTRPIPAWRQHWTVGGYRVGPCCIEPDEENAA